MGNLTQKHLKLDFDLEKIWSAACGGGVLFVDTMLRVLFVMMFLVGAIVCASHEVDTDQEFVAAWCVAGAFVAAATLLMNLYPLAQITALCQSQATGQRS